MDKQEKKEFIENILSWGSWCNEVHTGELDRYVKISKVRELIKVVNEPQKIKVPEFVAKWFETNKYVLDRAILDYMFEDYASDDSEFGKWFDNKNGKPIETLVRMLDGYEVEEEPKYYVNIGNLYLKEPLGDTSDFTISMTWNREYAYPFDSWNLASEHASKLGGTAKKVEVSVDINKVISRINSFNESGGREDKACAEGLKRAKTYIQQEVLKSKILTHDQQIVLEWLTENIHLGTLPFNQISLLNQSFFNSPIDTSDKYLKAFGDLDSQEQFQVLAAFAEWGMKNDQED